MVLSVWFVYQVSYSNFDEFHQASAHHKSIATATIRCPLQLRPKAGNKNNDWLDLLGRVTVVVGRSSNANLPYDKVVLKA